MRPGKALGTTTPQEPEHAEAGYGVAASVRLLEAEPLLTGPPAGRNQSDWIEA